MIRRGHAAERRTGRGPAHASRAAFSRCSVSAVVRVQHLVRFDQVLEEDQHDHLQHDQLGIVENLVLVRQGRVACDARVVRA